MKELASLGRLQEFVVGERKGAQITKLGDLNLLGGKLELKRLENVEGLEEAKSANLKHKTELTSLILSWSNDRESKGNFDDEEVLEGLEPNSCLKKLFINEYMGNMINPTWMIKLINLVKIKFDGCERCVSIPSLGKLPSLKVIKIWEMSALKGLEDDEFPSLEKLQISQCDELISLPSYLPKLRELYIDGCPKLHCLPDWVQELTTLSIDDCDVLQGKCKEENGEYWHKICHVPNLYLHQYGGLEVWGGAEPF